MSQYKKSNKKEANSKKIIRTQLRSGSFTFLNHSSLSLPLSSLMSYNYSSGLRASYVEAGVFVEITHHTYFYVVSQARSMKHCTDSKN